jgi:hypothetical protein
MVDMGDNLLVVMMDWTVRLEYILTNPKTVCWLLTGMDRRRTNLYMQNIELF